MRVEGLYHLRGTGKVKQVTPLNYPYPEDDLLGAARTEFLMARTDSAWVPLSYSEKPKNAGAKWWIPVSPGKPLVVRTVYRQQIFASYARYIVTTTRAWDRPLLNARFEIYLPEGARSKSFSYDFRWGEGKYGPCWVFEVSNFWPDKDIIVTWE